MLPRCFHFEVHDSCQDPLSLFSDCLSAWPPANQKWCCYLVWIWHGNSLMIQAPNDIHNILHHWGPLTWFNFNPSMDKWLRAHLCVRLTYLSIPKLQRLHRWSLIMDNQFHFTLYNGCNHLFMLGLKLKHVSKRGWWCFILTDQHIIIHVLSSGTFIRVAPAFCDRKSQSGPP